MKNKLSDLNNHLFAALERLSEEDLKDEKLKEEIDRSNSITAVSAQIIANAKLNLDAIKFLKNCGRDYDSANSALHLLGVGSGGGGDGNKD
jgi:hypothetical protein